MDEKAFEELASRIPLTWTCDECKQEFDNGPNGEMPEAVRPVSHSQKVKRFKRWRAKSRNRQ